MDPYMDPNVDPHMDSFVDPYMDPYMDPHMDPYTDPPPGWAQCHGPRNCRQIMVLRMDPMPRSS